MSILDILVDIGMTQLVPKLLLPGLPEVLTVLLDGCIVGCIPSGEVEKIVAYIRELKVSSASMVCFCQIYFSCVIRYTFFDIDLKLCNADS